MTVAGEFRTGHNPYSSEMQWPIWSGGALITFEKNMTATPVIHAFDANGQESVVVFSIAGADTINLCHVARGRDGTLAAAGNASDGQRKSGFIAWIAPDHQNATVVRMSGFYWPAHIALAPDGTIWTQGWEARDQEGFQKNFDAPVLRHFDKTGKMIGSLLPARSLSKPTRENLTEDFGFMVSSATRIAWMANGGGYYEVLDGKDVVEFPGVPLHGKGEFLVGMALTDSGQVFASTTKASGSDFPLGMYLYTLDRESGEWHLVQLPSVSGVPTENFVLGCDGDTLVFRTKDRTLHRFFRLN